MPIELPLTALPLKELLKNVYKLSAGPLRNRLKNYTTIKKTKYIYDHVREIGKVRTIWQTDRPVPIHKFYYPQQVSIEGEDIEIKKLSDLTAISNRVIVQGIVGQGKSIFLRYLCVEELKIPTSIPVFLELRKFVKDRTLIEEVRDYLEDIGLDSSQDTFEHLVSKGKIQILLDAYDEIDESIEPKVFKEIERFCRKYPKINLVVTSRPNYSIQNSEYFTITSISPLDESDLEPILGKLCTDKESAKEICKGINQGAETVKGLLTTPLMVTLLVFVYKSDQKIPTKPIEFYDRLFITVLSRHDKLKPGGVNRNRKTTISDTTFEKIFDCVSFLSSQDAKTSLQKSEMISYLDQAKKYHNVEVDSDDLLVEIYKITCLILKEGFDYNFLHKSIQEYHAAKFIASIPESRAIEFYKSIVPKGAWRKWDEQINFLIELDKYRCYKFFIIPSCDLAKKSIFDKKGKIKPALMSSFIRDTKISLGRRGPSDAIRATMFSDFSDNKFEEIASQNMITCGHLSCFLRAIRSLSLSEEKLLIGNDPIPLDQGKYKQGRSKLILLSALLKKTGNKTKFINAYSRLLAEEIRIEKTIATKIIKQLESSSSLFKP